jgi:ABC-type dipeptide/oligopeptide/nickel transport system permease subunit
MKTIHVFEYRRTGITRRNSLATRMTNPPEFLAPGGAIALQQPVAVVRKTPRRLFWERLSQDKAALAGGLVICLLVLIAIFGGPLAAHITGHGQNATYDSMTDDYGVPKGPNSSFWFGADAEGRDLFVRTMYGARISLFVGVVASGFAVLIGLVVGLVAGFFAGIVDTILSRLADVLLAVPQILIAVGIVAACSTGKAGCVGGLIKPGLTIVIVVITLFSWSYIARIVRGYTLSLREKEFVESARAAGASNVRVVGLDPERRIAAVRRRLVADAVPRRVPDHHHACLQPARRWTAGRVRCPLGAVMKKRPPGKEIHGR